MRTNFAPIRGIEPRPEFADILRRDRIRTTCEAGPLPAPKSDTADDPDVDRRSARAVDSEQGSGAAVTSEDRTPSATSLPDSDRFGSLLPPQSADTVVPTGWSDRLDGWCARLLIQSGISAGPWVMSLACVACAASAGGAVFADGGSLLVTAVAVAAGTVVPVGLVSMLRFRRRHKIVAALPAASAQFRQISRQSESRVDWARCIGQFGAATGGPLGDELLICAQRVAGGESPAAALGRLPRRTGVDAVWVLVAMAAAGEKSPRNQTDSTDSVA